MAAHMGWRAGVAVLLIAVATGRATAQGGPPMLTDDPGTVKLHGWEINTAFTAQAAGRERAFEAPLIDVNYGLGSHLQLKLEGPLLVASSPGSTRTALGNLSAGVKWRFLDQNGARGLDVSTYPQLTFRVPVGSARAALNDPVPQLLLPVQVAHAFGRFALNADAGYAFRRDQPAEISAGLAAGWTAGERWEWIAEVHDARERGVPGDEAYANVGLRHDLADDLTLLASAGRSLHREPAVIAFLGLQLTR
jgi:hypothetical protein